MIASRSIAIFSRPRESDETDGLAAARSALPQHSLDGHSSNDERKYYLSNLPADIPIKQLAGTIKARWICEQAHQQFKEELGLDHYDGRSWTGLHRHGLMTMIAYAFLRTRCLSIAGRKKEQVAHDLAPACQQSARPSLSDFSGCRPSSARTATKASPHPKITICQSSARRLDLMQRE